MMKNDAAQRRGLSHTVLISLGIALAGCEKFSDKTPLEHIDKALEHRNKGDLRSSSIELKEALQQNPDLMLARQLLGEINLKLGNGADAEKELRQALELGAPKETVLINLAEALVLQSKSQELLDQIEILPTMTPADQATLHTYRGDAWLSLKNLEKAEDEYQQGLNADSQAALPFMGLARLAAARKDLDKAEELLRQGLEMGPTEPRLWSLLGNIQKTRNKLDDAETSYSHALEYRPHDPFDRASRALVRVDLKKFADAAEDVKLLKKENPELFSTHYAAGMLAYNQKNYAEALAELERTVQANENFTLAYFDLGLAYLQRDQLEQAASVLAKFLQAEPRSMKGMTALALVKVHLKQYPQARELLKPVLQEYPDNQLAQNLMGNIELALGNHAAALQHIQRSAALSQNSALARARLGTAFMVAGQQEKGLEVLEEAVKLDPKTPFPDIAIAMTQISAKNYSLASEAITRLREKIPGSPIVFNLLGMLQFEQGEREKAKETFREGIKLAAGEPTLSGNLAQIEIGEGNLVAARRLYEEALAKNPKHLGMQMELATLDGQEGNFRQMEEILGEAIKDHPEALMPRVFLARHFLQFGEPQRAQSLLDEVRARYPENVQLLSALAEAQLAQRQTSFALATANTLARIAPKKALAHFLLSRAYIENNEPAKARTSLDEALKLDPQLAPARHAKIRLLTLEKKFQEAGQLLAALEKEAPSQPEVLALRAWVAVQEGKPQDAVGPYQAVLKLAPSSANLRNLVEAQLVAGQVDEAFKSLGDWLDQYPTDGLTRYYRSGIYAGMGKFKDARADMEKTLELNPNNVAVLNDLAWLIRRDDAEKAIEYAERAAELAPYELNVKDTLAMVLLEAGQTERALRILAQMAEGVSGNPTLDYHLAVAYHKNGQSDQAAQILDRILKDNRGFPERAGAEALMKTLSKSE